jgi:DNA-binding transcriptional LysR family regulator
MAISALERANIPGRVVLSSGSVSALWAAAAAGLGFTARTGIHVHRGISPADTAIGLPELPMVELSLYHADRFGHPAVAHFARIVRETVQRHIADLSAVASPRLGELQDSSSATST